MPSKPHHTSCSGLDPSGAGIRRSSDPQVPFVTTTARIDSRQVLPPAMTKSWFRLKVGIATTSRGCLGAADDSAGSSAGAAAIHAAAARRRRRRRRGVRGKGIPPAAPPMADDAQAVQRQEGLRSLPRSAPLATPKRPET